MADDDDFVVLDKEDLELNKEIKENLKKEIGLFKSKNLDDDEDYLI